MQASLSVRCFLKTRPVPELADIEDPLLKHCMPFPSPALEVQKSCASSLSLMWSRGPLHYTTTSCKKPDVVSIVIVVHEVANTVDTEEKEAEGEHVKTLRARAA